MGIFESIARGLRKTKEAFSKKIYELFTGRALNDEFYDNLEYALISSDVGAEATDLIIDRLKEESFSRRLKKSEDAIGVFKEILREIIDYEIEEYSYPLVILVAGVNGVGKTTAIGKLAYFFKSQGKSVVIAAADTFRAAASEQLAVWAERAEARIIKYGEGADPAAVVFDAINSAKAKNTDVVLIDTAGRLHNKKNLMEELKKINRVVEREYPESDYRTYLVLDATTGQNAVRQADIFDEAIDIDGIILTKLDGTAKGGVVIAISQEKEVPVVFVGVGEKIGDLLPFDAEDFVNSIF
jgi:fused signal recognition particle receptor